MSAEHRRQLLAFFIVALAAFLMVGNGLHNQFGTGNGQARTPAAIAAAIGAGPTISSGQSGDEAGGSARGTTVVQPATSRPTSVTTTSVTSAPLRAAPGHSDRARKADRADQRSKSSTQEHATKRSARSASDDQVARANSADDGKKAHAGKHDKKHDKKHGKKAHKQRSHRR